MRLLAIRYGAVVEPSSDARHVHTKPTPTLGGAAMFIGFLVAMAVASHIPQFHEMFQQNSEPFGLILGAGVMFVDRRARRPHRRVAARQARGPGTRGQLAVAVRRHDVLLPDAVQPVPHRHGRAVVADGAPLVTALWVVLMTNAINLIDGIDGLAAGIVAIAGGALFLFADRLFKQNFLDGTNIGPLVAIIAVGVCVGFLPFNWNPAKIIMGDAGALFLGVLLAVPTITIGGRTDHAFSGNTFFFFGPLLIPVIILGVPMLDTVFSFVRRLVRASTGTKPTRATCTTASCASGTARAARS